MRAARVAAGGVGEVERAEAAVEDKASGEVASAELRDADALEVEGSEGMAGCGEGLGKGGSEVVVDSGTKEDGATGS